MYLTHIHIYIYIYIVNIFLFFFLVKPDPDENLSLWCVYRYSLVSPLIGSWMIIITRYYTPFHIWEPSSTVCTVRGLQDRPDYGYLRPLLHDALGKEGGPSWSDAFGTERRFITRGITLPFRYGGSESSNKGIPMLSSVAAEARPWLPSKAAP